MFATMNHLQMCFHPTYAPEGQITGDSFFKLSHSAKDIMIIADKNIVSPICEIATKGYLNDRIRMQKIAMFIVWSIYLNSRVTSGIGLLENDTAGLSSVTGEETRLQFLHGVEKIPSQIWKEIAFGNRDTVPARYLYDHSKHYGTENKEYLLHDDFLYLSTEAAIIHLVKQIRCSELSAIDQFVSFMNWYTDHLDIAESIVVYAALVFSHTPNVALPKNSYSNDFQKITKGIKNQAWDITYITTWSMYYYNEKVDQCTFFATDDNTQKQIVINTIPPHRCELTLDYIFHTKKEKRKLTELYESRLGQARKRPFQGKSEDEKISCVKKLVEDEYNVLKSMIPES